MPSYNDGMREEPYHHSVIHYFGPDGRRASKSTPGAVRRATETQTCYAKWSPEGAISGKGQRWPRRLPPRRIPTRPHTADYPGRHPG